MLRLKSLIIAGIIAVPVLVSAADFKFYSSHRQGWWGVYQMEDSVSTTTKADPVIFSTFNSTNNNTFISNSRFGAKVSSKDYEGAVELALRHPKNSDKNANVRLAWGKWYFAKGVALTIGITDAPFSIKSAGQGYFEQVDQGKFTGKRSNNDKVMLYQLEAFGAKLALVNNQGTSKQPKIISVAKDDEIGGASTMAPANDQKITVIKDVAQQMSSTPVPGIQFKYGWKNDMLELNAMGAFNTFKFAYRSVTDSLKTEKWTKEIDINAFAIGADATLKVSILSLSAGFSYGVNPEHTGINTTYSVWNFYKNGNYTVPSAVACIEDGEVINSTMWGLPVSLTASFTKDFALVAGFGIGNIAEKGGASKKSDFEAGKIKEMGKDITQLSAYLNAKWKVRPGLTFQPEVGFIDYGTDNWVETTKGAKNLGSDIPNEVYFGFLTQVDL